MNCKILSLVIALGFLFGVHADHLYVVNELSNDVSVVDTATYQVIATIIVGREPSHLVATPDGKKVYVMNNAANDSISVIDTQTQIVVATISLIPNPATPIDLAISPDGQEIYVAVQSQGIADSSVNVIDTQTDQVTNIIPIKGSYPTEALSTLLASFDGNTVYVADVDDNKVSVIDAETKQVLSEISVGKNPQALVSTPDSSKVYSLNTDSHDISVINTVQLLATIPLGFHPSCFIVTPDGEKLYVSSYEDDFIAVIDAKTNKIITKIAKHNYITAFAVTADSKTIYAVDYNAEKVLVIDTVKNEVVNEIIVGIDPWDLKMSSDGKLLYVLDSCRGIGTGDVMIIDLSEGKVTHTVEVESIPLEIAVIP